MPNQDQEIPDGDSPQDNEELFYCLLENDRLISSVAVKTHQLLEDHEKSNFVEMLLVVKTRQITASWKSY